MRLTKKNKVNIALYIGNCKIENGGAYPYIISILKIISKKKNSDFKFYIFSEYQNYEISELLVSSSIFHQKIILVKQSLIVKLFNKILNTLGITQSISINYSIWKYHIQIFHSLFQYMPIGINVKRICTIHDLQDLHFPEYFHANERIARGQNNFQITSNSNLIICSYDHIKKDIIKYFGFENIEVFLTDMTGLITTKSKPVNEFIGENFVFYPAATWEHKNHINLIKAIDNLKQKGIIINLLVSGKKTEFYFSKILPAIKALKIETQINFVGILEKEQIVWLYKNVKAAVIPTLYEAGSFPLYEAMLLNTPVICSSVTSLPETIGNTEFCFDPLSIKDISEKLEKITTDCEYIQRNRINSSELIVNWKMIDYFKNLEEIYAKIIP